MADRFHVVLIAPFLKPANGVGDTPPLPYYLYVSSSHRTSDTYRTWSRSATVLSVLLSCYLESFIGPAGESSYRKSLATSLYHARRPLKMVLWSHLYVSSFFLYGYLKEADLGDLVLSSQDQKSLSDTGSLSFPSFSFSFCLAQMFVLFVTLIHDCHETYNQYPPT